MPLMVDIITQETPEFCVKIFNEEEEQIVDIIKQTDTNKFL